jgi:hypothetical protein
VNKNKEGKKKNEKFLIRVAIIAITFPLALGIMGWFYYDQIRAKSLYYRLADSGLISTLEGGDLIWSGESLELNLYPLDSLYSSENFNPDKLKQISFSVRNSAGELLVESLSFDALSDQMKRIMRKVPELGLREMRTPEKGHLEFRIGKTSWLHYTTDPTSDQIAEYEGVRMLDEHWYILTRR